MQTTASKQLAKTLKSLQKLYPISTQLAKALKADPEADKIQNEGFVQEYLREKKNQAAYQNLESVCEAAQHQNEGFGK